MEKNILIKNLSSNEEETRNSSLKQFINTLHDDPLNFNKNNWVGIFYFIYHLDNKLHEQQKTWIELSKIFRNLEFNQMLNHLKEFFIVLNKNFNSVDNHRVNKFYFAIKKILIQVYANLFSNLTKLNIKSLNSLILKFIVKFDMSISLEIIENFFEIFSNVKNLKINTSFLIIKPLIDSLNLTNFKILKKKIFENFKYKLVGIIFEKVNNKNKIKKLNKYFFKYSSSTKIENHNRKFLYDIYEFMNLSLENFQESDINIGNDIGNINIDNENDNINNEIDNSPENNNELNKDNDLKPIDNLENDSQGNLDNTEEVGEYFEEEEKIILSDYNIPSDEEFDTLDDIFDLVKKYCPEKYDECVNKFSNFKIIDDNTDEYNTVSNGIDEDNNYDEDLGYNPYDNLSLEELREKLPKYYFLSQKKKRKFFNKLNNTFKNSLVDRKSKKIKKTSFKMTNNKIKNFDKNRLIG